MSQPRASRLPPGAAAAVVCAAIALVVASSAGCQRRVIGARGVGADSYTIEQPQQGPGATWENRLLGPPPSARSGSRLK